MKKKVVGSLVVAVAVLAVFSIAMDWMAFCRCGAVEQCLVGCYGCRHLLKLAIPAIMTVVVFLIGGDGICPKDRHLLLAAFVLALCAEFCMKVLHVNLLGICFFMAVQTLFIFRHSHGSDSDRSFPRILCIPLGALPVAAISFAFGLFDKPTVPIVAAYGVFVACSLVVACKARGKGYFPSGNAKLIKWGMVLFFCCDVCVGISGATGADHSAREIAATIAHNFVWAFYTPALVLLGLSGYTTSSLPALVHIKIPTGGLSPFSITFFR